MQFSENQKYYLKRFAALHMPEIGRKAAYVRQELKTTWMAVDSTSVPDGVVYVYHNKEYKHIEDIVADVLDIHGDSAKIMQINNTRLACGLPTFVTWEKAETLYTIPGDKEKREIVTCMDYLSVYGINPDEVYAMQVKKSWMTTGVSFDPEASMESGDRTVALPFDDNSDMGAYYDVLQSLGNALLVEDRRNIHCSITYSIHNIDTLFAIWRDKPGLEMSVGYAEYHVDGTYFPGDYLLTVKASGAINEFGKEQYKAKATLFYENMIVDSVDYPFGNDRLTSVTTSPNAVDNWAKLFDYARYALLTVALFHDLCKISTYTVSTRNVKDDTTGQWTKVPFYKFEPKDSVGCDSHGSLSCYRIMATGMPLSMEEFAAVNNHMGVSNAANANTVWTCYEMHPLSWLLHVADEAATALDKI